MNIQRYKSKDIKHINGEALREHKSRVGDVDPARTHLNVNLAPVANICRTKDELTDRIRQLGYTRKIRSDATLMDGVIITMPKDYTGDVDAFMRSAYKNFVNLFCQGDERRVLLATVHKDEKTPHLHFHFIPLIEKDGKIKLSHKDLISKSFLQKFHPWMSRLMSEDLGQDIRLYDADLCKEREQRHLNGDRSLDHVTIEEYKSLKQKEAHSAKLEAKIAGMTADLDTVDETLNIKLQKLTETSDELNDLLLQSTDTELRKKQNKVKTLTDTITSLSQKIPPLNDLLRMLADLWMMMDKYKHRQAMLKGLKDEGYTLYNENEGKEIDIDTLLVEDTLNKDVEDLLAQAEDVIEDVYEGS